MTSPVSIGDATLYCGDCSTILPTLGPVDAVVTDPPYGIGAPSMTLGTGKKQFIRGEWDSVAPDVTQFLLVGSLHCFWGGNYFSDQLPVSNDWLIWHKKNDGLSFSEAEMAWTDFGCNVRHLSHHWSGEEKVHPTMKPIDVMMWCISFVPNAVIVLDPFMGSGTTGVACARLGRKFIGIEIEPRYFDIACKRISREYEQLKLFPPEEKHEAVQMELEDA